MSSRPIRGAARLAAILDALPDALLLVNSNGTVVDANQAAVQSLQAPGTSLVGMGVLDLLPEFDPSRIPGSMRPAPREPDGLDHPVRMTARRTDGSAFPVEVSGNDFADDGSNDGRGSEGRGYAFSSSAQYGSSSGSDLLLLLVRDLSSRLGVEAELRRQHKQTEMILRAAAEGVLGVDLEGRVVLVNPAAAHILDYRASELGGRELHPLIQHSQADGSPLALEGSALLDTLLSGRKHRVRGTVLWRKDGQPVTVDLTTAPVRDGDQLVGAVMTFTDRTRELALVARNEHLTAVLESELGTALTALHRRIDALAADPAGQLWPEANWTLRRLADECRRFGTLINGVLTHQRFEDEAETGGQSLEREPVRLDKIVQRAVERAGELVGAGRVRYSVHAASVEVTADRERLAQALAHLVADVSGVALSLDGPAAPVGPASLGVPALPPVGPDAPMVVLAAAQRGDVARIEVRGPARTSSPVHLPIARAIVERHGGVLQRHELPNRAGTTYVVELPLDPAAAKAAKAGQRHVPKETDTAMLPDLPEVPPAPPEPPKAEQPDRTAPEEAAPEPSAAQPAEQPAARGPIALGSTALGSTALGPIALGPAAPARPEVEELPVHPAPEASSAPEEGAAAEQARSGRRRRAAAAAAAGGAEPSGALSIPGIPDPGTPFYPGLEHALPLAPPEPVAPPAVPPTGRRRRLALPAQASAGGSGSGAELELAKPHVPERPSTPPAVPTAPAEVSEPRPVGSGLGELAPPRPLGGFASAFPNAFPQPDAAPEQPPAPPAPNAAVPAVRTAAALPATTTSTAATAAPDAPGQVEPRTPPRPVSELARSSAEQPEPDRAETPDFPNYPTMVGPAVDGGARRLLVWPEPDPSTKQALQDRGYRPVIVRSREEVDAQVAAYPAALFVDPLTGPITRTALQSLRTAALNSRVPVLVTAGLGQATRDAAYGADPAVLLRALAPRDSEQHAPRVLLVEADPDIAAALISSLERRGMHVEHAVSENDAVSRASSVQPNLVVMDLLQIRRRRVGLLDWLRANDRLHRTPLVVYTSVDLDPQELPRLRTGETVLFLAERSTTEDVQSRIVDLLGRIGAMGEVSTAGR
ncbi:PAS domain-containing protein [Kitasatospora sp. MAP5-34]|uniref:PAS domain-containing protein n=1 Tax=Kitasatospora sp. MAP5-34 TaxID=3035102 RepID=UPI0024732AFC|nr:PAS domain-containing protein [Kitasatospora sp. MAP5-34]MDH6576287.1 PAS domain S-box-containing protein [Kitasatospora sp. MAP5-34]